MDCMFIGRTGLPHVINSLPLLTTMLHMQEHNVVFHNLPQPAEGAWELPEQERRETREPAPV